MACEGDVTVRVRVTPRRMCRLASWRLRGLTSWRVQSLTSWARARADAEGKATRAAGLSVGHSSPIRNGGPRVLCSVEAESSRGGLCGCSCGTSRASRGDRCRSRWVRARVLAGSQGDICGRWEQTPRGSCSPLPRCALSRLCERAPPPAVPRGCGQPASGRVGRAVLQQPESHVCRREGARG